MNERIETFLSKYTCEEINGKYWGSFSNTRYLHKVRDALNDDDWRQLMQNIPANLKYLPGNLKTSLNRKFEDMEEFQLNHDCENLSPGKLLKEYESTVYKRTVQKLVWGVITSCIEVEHFKRLKQKPATPGRWNPFISDHPGLDD